MLINLILFIYFFCSNYENLYLRFSGLMTIGKHKDIEAFKVDLDIKI